jgi:nicotinamidase-related amidase
LPLSTIDPATSALLVLDFINEIVEPDGVRYPFFRDQLLARNTVENMALAVDHARERGLQVIFVGVGWRAGYPDQSPTPQMAAARKLGGFADGSWGCEVSARLAPREDEVVVRKRGVSAFNGTELQRYLTVQRISTLALGGIATNWVVESTARDASDLGYEPVVLEDCCASFTAEMHEFSVTNILPVVGRVSSVHEFSEAISSHSEKGAGSERSNALL